MAGDEPSVGGVERAGGQTNLQNTGVQLEITESGQERGAQHRDRHTVP